MTFLGDTVVQGYLANRSLSGLSITYTRPEDGHSVSVVAIPGYSLHQVDQDGVVVDEYQSRDFLILASDLILNGVQVEPKRGDVITDGSYTFKILAQGGQPHWRWVDATRTIYRVFTKET